LGIGLSNPTNYNSITKPLVAEPFSINCQFAATASTIHSGAGNVSNVFFGGNASPSGMIAGSAPTAVFTKQIFDLSDFPIYMETDFYVDSNSPLYSEGYFWIGPANYQHYSATFMIPSGNREGVLVGKFPDNSGVWNNNLSTQPTTVLSDSVHNLATYGSWYNFKAVFDTINGNLVLRDLRINNQCIYDYTFTFNQTPWLNNFRVAVCVDDLAKDFKIITNYSALNADFSSSDTTICIGDCINFTNLSIADYCNSNTVNNNYQWYFDGATINTSNQEHPSNVCFSTVGTHNVTLIVNNQGITDTIIKTITVVPLPLVDLGNDTLICTNHSMTLDATLPNATYLWSDNSSDPTLTINTNGQYWVEVTVGDCSMRDTIQVTLLEIPSLDLGNDTTICLGDFITLDVNHANIDSYLWQDSSTNSTFTISQAGSYFVTTTNACGSVTDSIIVDFYDSNLSLELGNDTTLCVGEVVVLDATHPNGDVYIWQDSSIQSSFMVMQSGIYSVEISNLCERISDTITIDYYDLPLQSNFESDTVAICEGEYYILNAFRSNATNYLWNDGSITSTLTVFESGIYEVEVSNICNTTTDSITVIVSQPQLILELGMYQNICEGDTIILDATTENAIWYQWQDNTTAPLYTITAAGEYQVTVQNGCGERTDNIIVTNEDCCSLFIPNAFSPNNDGENDIFKVYQPSKGCNTINSFSMKIFDRWGEMVYSSDNINDGWDGFWQGKELSVGVYVFMIEYHDGVKNYLKKGDITIVR
jgi:gliding motility-associated-like protein